MFVVWLFVVLLFGHLIVWMFGCLIVWMFDFFDFLIVWLFV